MKKVLIAVHIDSHFIELLRVARLLKESGAYDPLLWFQSSYPAIESDLSTCCTEGLNFVQPTSIGDQPIEKEEIKRWRRPSLDKLPSILRFIILTIRAYKLYRHEARRMNELLEQHKPDLLILPEDDIAYKFYILIKVSLARGISTVIIPFTIVNATERAESYYDQEHFRVSGSLGNRLIGSLYPHWVYSYKGYQLLFMSAVNILAISFLTACVLE